MLFVKKIWVYLANERFFWGFQINFVLNFLESLDPKNSTAHLTTWLKKQRNDTFIKRCYIIFKYITLRVTSLENLWYLSIWTQVVLLVCNKPSWKMLFVKENWEKSLFGKLEEICVISGRVFNIKMILRAWQHVRFRVCRKEFSTFNDLYCAL